MSSEQPSYPPYGQSPYGETPPWGQAPYAQGPYYAMPAGPPPVGDPGTLDLPWYGIGFGGAIRRGFAKYARFDGRASRSEFWWFALGTVLVYPVLGFAVLAALLAESEVAIVLTVVVTLVYLVGIIVPSVAIAIRRLHDAGFTGWLYLTGFLPYIGGLVFVVLCCQPPKPEGARFDRYTPGSYDPPR